LSNYAEIAGEYTTEENLPENVTADDLMNSATYKAAKKTGLANALNLTASDVTITGFAVHGLSDRLPSAVRQLSRGSHVNVTTYFTVQISGSQSADSLTAAIAASAAAIQAATNDALAASDWAADPVISSAPVLAAPSVGAAGSTAGVTSAPTPVPVVIGANMGVVSGTGDPHLQNVLGERFDLMQAGRHVLIQIPRGADTEGTLLRVEAEAQRLGEMCADMYFQELNLTGKWAEEKQAGGLRYRASEAVTEDISWVRFGRVDLKVAHGRTLEGMRYLNIYVKHLSRAGFSVGGLLGEDDHRKEATTPQGCRHRRMSLLETRDGPSTPAASNKEPSWASLS
jgi:hypothetical protein